MQTQIAQLSCHNCLAEIGRGNERNRMTVRKSGNAPCAWQASYVDLYISFDTCKCVCRSNRIYGLMGMDWSNIQRFSCTIDSTRNYRLRNNNNDHAFRQVTQTLFPLLATTRDRRAGSSRYHFGEHFAERVLCFCLRMLNNRVFVRSTIARLNNARWCGLFHIIWGRSWALLISKNYICYFLHYYE